MTSTTPVAQSVDAQIIHDAIRGCGITHAVIVPDTIVAKVIERLDADPDIRTINVCTEDEAMCIHAGLYMGGAEPMMVIQETGLYACINSLRAIALDAEVPTLIFVGLFGRDVNRTVEDNRGRTVRLIAPVMDALDVPHYLIDGPDDVGVIATAFAESRERRGPVVVFLGAPAA